MIVRYLITFMMFTAPCLAGMGIGGFPYPGPGVVTQAAASFCGGTDLFCTSWETGTDALNTGATGNEDVFNAISGSVERFSTATIDGSYSVRFQNGAYIEATNNGLGYNSSIRATGFFRMDDESAGVGQVVVFRDNNSYYNFMSITREADSSTSDNSIPMSLRGKFTSGTEVTIGTFSVTEDVWYKFDMSYNMTTDVSRLLVYTTSDVLVYDSGNVSTTLSFTIDSIRLYNQGIGYVSVDGIKVNN